MQAAAPLWTQGVALVAVRGAWESAAIGLFFAVVIGSGRALSAVARFRVWAAGFIAAAALPFLHVGSSASTAVAGAPLMQSAHFAPVGVAAGWAVGVCGMWAAASTVALLRLGAGAWSLGRLVRRARPAPACVHAAFGRVAPKTGRATRARLLISEKVTGPSACGLFGVAVLLPVGLAESLSTQDLECVLRHEAAHLARRDDWLAMLTAVTRALFPLSFAMPFLERGMARAREMACDDAALACGVSRPGYAACLARMAERSVGARWSKLAPGLGGNGSQLAQRIGHVLDGVRTRVRFGRLRAAVAACAGLLLVSALASAPALFVFVAPAPQFARVTPTRPGVVPSLAAPALSTELPLHSMRLARWAAPAHTANTAPLMNVAENRPNLPQALLPSPGALLTHTQASRLNVEPASSRSRLSAQPLSSFFLLWRQQQFQMPSAFMLVFPATGRDASATRILLLSI